MFFLIKHPNFINKLKKYLKSSNNDQKIVKMIKILKKCLKIAINYQKKYIMKVKFIKNRNKIEINFF